MAWAFFLFDPTDKLGQRPLHVSVTDVVWGEMKAQEMVGRWVTSLRLALQLMVLCDSDKGG